MTAQNRPWAMVTGASGGIGLELARLLAARGYDLVLVARSSDKLEQLGQELGSAHGIRYQVVAEDLSDSEAPTRLSAALGAMGISPEVLVNNAGLGTYGPFSGTSLAAELELLQVNIVALTHLTKLFLPPMLARGRGRILNVASTAGFQPGPLMAVYYASKAYVLHFTEAVAEELAGTGVTATALCPGPVLTGFQAQARMQESGLMKRLQVLSADAVARRGIKAMEAGKRIAVPGIVNAVAVASGRLAPRWLVAKITRFLNAPSR